MRTSALFRSVSAIVALALILPAGGMLSAPAAHAFDYKQCSNGMDDDGDGKFDYPRDPECDSLDDNTEAPNEGLFVTVSDGRETVAAGDALVYVITLKQQRDAVKLVDLSLHVPAQNSVVSISDDGSFDSTGVRWTKVAVFKNVTRRLTVHVVVNPYTGPEQMLIARVLADGVQAVDTTMINGRSIPYAQNQLQVEVSDHRDSASPGDVLDYVVSVRNTENTDVDTHVRVKIPVALRVTDSNGAVFSGDEIVWMNVHLDPNQERSFSFRAEVDSRVPNHYPIQVVARAGNVVGYDRTITGGTPYSLYSSITDNREVASPGDLLTYVIHVDNGSGRLDPHAYVGAGLPIYAEFVSANDGGTWDGNNVRWQNLQVAPGGSRDLEFTIRVRSDAPDGASLRATATVQNFTSSDVTEVRNGYSSGISSRYAGLQIDKSADRSSASAGSSLSYTIVVHNNQNRVLRDVAVSDVYDASAFTVTDAGSGRAENGRIAWRISTLQPGETRTLRYTGRLSRALRNGDAVYNTARAYTNDVAYIPSAGSSIEISDQLMPQTGIEDFFGPIENTAEFLTPIAAAANGNATPLALWLIAVVIGLSGGVTMGKKYVL